MIFPLFSHVFDDFPIGFPWIPSVLFLTSGLSEAAMAQPNLARAAPKKAQKKPKAKAKMVSAASLRAEAPEFVPSWE